MTIAIVAVALGSGCASYNEQLIDADGRERQCQMTGWGGIGMRQAEQGVSICRETLTSLGFVDRDQTGEVGITDLRREPGYLSIGRVSPDSSAARQGVEAGDALLSIDGRRVLTLDDARRRLFGRVGGSARIEVMQGDIARTVVLEREGPRTLAARSEAQGIDSRTAAPVGQPGADPDEGGGER